MRDDDPLFDLGEADQRDVARPAPDRRVESAPDPAVKPSRPPAQRAPWPGSAGSRPPRRPAKRRSWRKEIVLLLVIALGLAIVIRTFLLQVFFIPSESMEDTLREGDRVLVNKLVYDLRDIRRGEIVVFDGVDVFADPPEKTPDATSGPVERALRTVGRWLGAPTADDKVYIKRVIGTPGDRVACCDNTGRVTVNGVPVTEDFLFPGDKPSDLEFNTVVPPHRLWVMGDHRSSSADSREHLGRPGGGMVPVDQVIGRAFLLLWPFDRLQSLPVPKGYEELNEDGSDGG